MIIKEKGKTKCFFYSDDKCRYGDRTRDCINCVRVTYHSLYSLNFDNQERLQKKIKHKGQECKELKKELEAVYDDCKGCPTCNEALYNANLYAKECRELKQTLTKIKEICNNNDELQGDFDVVDCDKYKLGKHNLANKILQKISECEAENAR